MASELLDGVDHGQSEGWKGTCATGWMVRSGLDAGTRGAYSTDASNFRQVPVGVVLPRTPEAAVEAVAVCRDRGTRPRARGPAMTAGRQALAPGRGRVLIVGWPSFLHGEATAGDVLAMEAARGVLSDAGLSARLHSGGWKAAAAAPSADMASPRSRFEPRPAWKMTAVGSPASRRCPETRSPGQCWRAA